MLLYRIETSLTRELEMFQRCELRTLFICVRQCYKNGISKHLCNVNGTYCWEVNKVTRFNHRIDNYKYGILAVVKTLQ